MGKAKHVPQRTCAACRATGDKRSLVRIVRTPEGRVAVDETGKRNGRGAYLCARRECWDLALRKDRLNRALRTSMSPEDRRALQDYGQRFAPEGATVTS
jgi:predicted RNA-binding protein YlxR (DUF448 family)